MNSSRVFILASQSLFAKGVQSLLSGQTGIEVVGVASVGPDAFAQAQATAPDVVIIEAGGEEQSHVVAQVLESVPEAKVIGLSLEDNRIHTYYQQMKQGRCVEDLFEAIRESVDWHGRTPSALRLLVLFQEHYGQRILENVRRFAPETWTVKSWRAPSALSPLVDDPLKFLPMHLPAADLVLSVGESVGVAHILPSVVERVGARSVIAPVDNVAWLPDALVRQLRVRLRDLGVTAVFPKPFCSLTERSYNVRQQAASFEDPWIGEFARLFGRPVFRGECEPGDNADTDLADVGPDRLPDRPPSTSAVSGVQIADLKVQRDAPCGCARSIARQLVGLDVREAISQAGLCHQYYPCLATMGVDPVLGEPLVQVSGDFMQQAVKMAVEECLSQLPDAETSLMYEGRGEFS